MQKILEKVDEALSHRDYKEAERILTYWLDESNDRDKITLLNELLGIYRKTGQEEKALETVPQLEALLEKLSLTSSETAATSFINIATVYSAFGLYQKAIGYYQRSEILLHGCKDNALLASLFNNMGTCYTMLKIYNRAVLYLYLALTKTDKELDMAITYLNLADIYLYHKKHKAKEDCYLKKARYCFKMPNIPQDGYYAFVAEKCAPGFRAHGDEEFATYLERMSKEIYERA